jgi:hypothetical protein
MPSLEAPKLAFSEKESSDAKKQWEGNCGPHALAAAVGISLKDVRTALPRDFRGTMSPTQMTEALGNLRIKCVITKRLNTKDLRNGLGYVQWTGRCLRSSYKSERYRYTHWIASRDGWVFETMTQTFGWMKEDAWRKEFDRISLSVGTGWYFWQWFELER